MQPIAIELKGLGKKYRLGRRQRYGSLRESLAEAFASPLRGLRRLAGGAPSRSAAATLWALRDVSFKVPAGEVVGIIGRNGAGKSTLLKILSRITEPTEGEAEIRGRVGSLLEVGTGFHPELTGRENIFLNGAVLGMRRAEIARRFDEIVAFSEIGEFLDTPVKHYSSGMQVRLAFSVAAHLEPEILFIDEVLAVGDFAFQRKCLGAIEDVAKRGRTVLFVSHQMEAVSSLCSRCILLEDGRVIEDGPPSKVIERYLGSVKRLAEVPLEGRLDRIGDGRLRWVETWVEDASGRRATNVQSGSDVSIVGRYRLKKGASVSKVVAAFALYGRSGVQLTDLSNLTTGEMFDGPLPGEGLVRCRLPKLPLNAGLYTYNMIARSGMAVEDFVQNAGAFEVESGDYFGTGRTVDRNQGMFLMPQRWELVA